MMMAAKQNAIAQIGFPVIAMPLFDVVGFGPDGWSFTVGPTTSAVSGSEGQPLPVAEEPLPSTEIDHLTASIEDYGGDLGVAADPLNSLDGDRIVLAFDVAGASPSGKVRLGDQHREGWPMSSEYLARVCIYSDSEQFQEHVRDELLRRPGVGHDDVDSGLFPRIHEPGTSSPRRGDLVVDAVYEGRSFRIEIPGIPGHPVGVPVSTQRTLLLAGMLASRDALHIKVVTQDSSVAEQLVSIQLSCTLQKNGRSGGERFDAHLLSRFAQSAPDRLCGGYRQDSRRDRGPNAGQPRLRGEWPWWITGTINGTTRCTGTLYRAKNGIMHQCADSHEGQRLASGRSGRMLHKRLRGAKPCCCASPAKPSSREERLAVSAASIDAQASRCRRASATAPCAESKPPLSSSRTARALARNSTVADTAASSVAVKLSTRFDMDVFFQIRRYM